MKRRGLRADASARTRAAALAARIAIVVAAPLVGTSVALAGITPIYRCGNAYSQWPCPSARAVAIDDASPSPAERADAARVAAAQARRADQLRAERLAAESRARPALAGSVGPAPWRPAVVPRPRRAGERRATRSPLSGADGDFIAHVPAAPKHRSRPP